MVEATTTYSQSVLLNSKAAMRFLRIMSAMQAAWMKQLMPNIIHSNSTEAGFPVYQQPGQDYQIGNGPAGKPAEIQTGGTVFGVTATKSNLVALFHTHPPGTSGLPSSPNNTSLPGGVGDTGAAIANNTDIFVISDQGLSKAPAAGPLKPKYNKNNSPWIVRGNGIDDWMKKLKKKCGSM